MQNTVGQQQYQQCNCPQYATAPAVQQPQVQTQAAGQTYTAPAYTQPQTAYYPAPQVSTQGQTVSVPNYSGVNIQIFNPSVGVPGGAPVYNVNAPQYQNPGCYPSGYYTNNWGQGANASNAANNANNANSSNTTTNTTNTTTTKTEEKKKTEKRDIVMLTDDYIKNLENYLNSQDKEIRLMGAKEVAARLQEDESRKDDKALTALINKMLQDPYQPVRFLALGMLDTRAVTGDDYTVQLLQQMQQSDSGYGQDALQASQILLKMSGQTVKKEFEVKDTPKKDDKK